MLTGCPKGVMKVMDVARAIAITAERGSRPRESANLILMGTIIAAITAPCTTWDRKTVMMKRKIKVK